MSLLLDRGFSPNIIHVHALWHAAAAASIVSDRLGIPYVVTEHSEEYARDTERMLVKIPGVLPLVLRPLARRASAYIAVSEDLASRLRELGICDDIDVIPNVVPERTSPVAAPLERPLRILHVSQLGPAKNIPLLLGAVHKVTEHRQDFLLEIGGDSPYRADAERLARELGIAGTAVSFLGMLSRAQVQEALDGAAFTVLSSTHENSSVFAAESLMAGRPLLTTACGGHTEYLDATLGRIVANDDVGALAEGLDWMLDHYTEFDAAHLNEFARARFSEQAVCSQLLSIYREVLDA
jgi:glycosyltransferase involved in cell wall biosynthesis